MRLLADPIFIQFFVPLITVGLSVFLKFVTRNDLHISFQKEDLAFGIDLTITALLIFIVSASSVVQQATLPNAPPAILDKAGTIPWILLFIFVGLWAMSTLVRKRGWKGEGKLHGFWGIVVPDVLGVLVLLFVVNWIKP
ncbi:MAG: hypothetical protein ACRERU_15575 [Methylococcales bacterium]